MLRKNLEQKIISLWRNRPPLNRGKTDKILQRCVFPSGRQALTYALRAEGLTRENRVALPEWSSACLISAVGKVATPIPLKEVLKNNIKVEAVLIYEQWGWPLLLEFKEDLQKKFKKNLLIVDRVNSADLDDKKRPILYPARRQLEIFSLSKILGLLGGGLLKADGQYVRFIENKNHKILSEKIGKFKRNNGFGEAAVILKNDIESLAPDLIRWLKNNNLLAAIENEAEQRRENLHKISESSLVTDWPHWMRQAIAKGAAPSIAPIFKAKSEYKLKQLKEIIRDRLHLETEVYHFNWAGNPLVPNYQRCLALPIHGLIKNMHFILNNIEQLL